MLLSEIFVLRFKPFVEPTLLQYLNALLFVTRVARSTKKNYMRSYVAIYFWCFFGPLSTFLFYLLLRPGTDLDGKLLSALSSS